MESYFDDLRRLQTAYARLLEPVCRQWGLTRNELDVLLFLFNNPSLDRAADIVACRGIAKSHVSQSITALEQRGFLTKQADPADRRSVHLCLTASARLAALQGKQAQQQLGNMLVTGLEPGELAQLTQLGAKIRRNIRKLEE